MTRIFKTVFSMSFSGAVLIAVLLFCERLLKGRLGRQWRYYIWLIAVMRLLLPFGPEASLMGQAHRRADWAVVQIAQESGQTEQDMAEGVGQSAKQNCSRAVLQSGSLFSKAMTFAGEYLWTVWLSVGLGMLIRKISMYQSYIKYVTAGAGQVCDVSLLDQLGRMTEQVKIGRQVELCVNQRISSPMLVGYRHPCIVLPDAEVQERDFQYIVIHELTHYKRRDILYKWLVQFVVCLHWFNPFVHIMSREIGRACEFACDEAVVAKMGYDHAADYGETLLNAMAAGGTYREPPAVVTMSANKELLRERLGAIMNGRKKTKKEGIIMAWLTVSIVLGAFFIGVYPASADGEFPRKMTVAMPVCRIREGAGEEFKVVGLLEEGKAVTVLGRKEGTGGQMWYLLDRESLSEKPDASVEECYIRGDLLEEE